LIDEEIIIFLIDLNSKSDLNFIKLINFIKESNIPFFSNELVSAFGIATFYGIHLDIRLLKTISYDMVYFIILHEIGHYKRIIKKGKQYHLHCLSDNNIDNLYNHILIEEIIADKYGSLVFRLLNNINFQYEKTQQLNSIQNQFKFYPLAQSMCNIIQNDEEKYIKLVNDFIVKK
jgi:hypothetical protein